MLQHTAENFSAERSISFKGLTQASGRVRDTKKVMYHQGDEANCIYRVNSGVVMTYRLLEDSQRQITGFCTAGDFFGVTATDTHNDTAITVSTSNITRLTMGDIQDSATLQEELFKWTCGQLEETQDMMMTLSKKSAGEKVSTFLLLLAKRQGGFGRDTDIRLPMSRLDIADYLGMSIETVSRNLTKLKRDGVIGLPNQNTAHIFRMGALETSAGARV